MKYKKSVFRNFALITQFGISMLVPVALCVFIGLLIDKKFGTYWVILFIFLGILAGGRNIYKMAMAALKDDERSDKKREEEHDE